MPKKAKKIPVYLTPEQIKQAYEDLIREEHEDWLYEPQVVEEILKRGSKARKEATEGKAISWNTLKKELNT